MSGALYMPYQTPVAKSFQQNGMDQFGNEFSGDATVAMLALGISKAMGLGGGAQSGEDPAVQLASLQKAMATGDLSGFGDATALRLENLDDTMTSVLYDNSHLVMWNWINRTVSKQPLYEWNRRKRYGGGRRTPGFAEGGTPRASTGAWERKNTNVRYMGVRRGVTHQALTTGALGGMQIDPQTEEQHGGTLDLLGLTERWMKHGKSTIKKAGGSTLNYDGIFQQMQAAYDAGEVGNENVIDKRGEALTFDDLEQAALNLFRFGKLPSTANLATFMPPEVLGGFSAQKLPAERAALATEVSVGQYVVGVPLSGYRSNRGLIPFTQDIFLEEVEEDRPVTDALELEESAPPSPTTASAAAASDATGDWSGTFYYGASAIDDGGESLITMDGSSQAITVAQKGVITIARVNQAHGYRIYRGTEADGSDARLIATIPQPTSGDATYNDTNSKIPGTRNVLMLHNEKEDLTVAQMSPLIKMPLGINTTTMEFLLLLYHVPVVKAPERQIWFKNVGSYFPAAA